MKNKLIRYVFVIACLYQSCKDDATINGESDVPVETITPVTLTSPGFGDMSDTIEINAVSSFLLKTNVKATANGYLETSYVELGKYVTKGQTLFMLKTKEAEALGNTINQLDTSLHFHGTVAVKSPGNGYVTQLSFTSGSYVQDGELLAEITDTKSFAFLLDLPYELKPYISDNNALQLRLPDGTTLNGFIESELPTLDSVAQTQRFIIKTDSKKLIPENLIAKVTITKSRKNNAVILPKAAVLSNEEQTEFWIMQMISDSVAVKVPVEKGLETKQAVEIISPPLTASAKILLTGNYGLEDTAKVRVIKP
ncbi:MAG TPA: efflux RND transporter periplasmic adaptor subunit [Panacibacter sp.]|nr:efflux RND transporter periplasmic adaptor subunit [Panacibacter sp.]